MITAVTLDPRIRMTLELPALREGAVQLADKVHSQVRASGLQLALALRSLGMPVMCTGISRDGNGRQLEDMLERCTVHRQFAVAHGSIPTDIVIEGGGTQTRILEQPDPVHPTVVDRYLEILQEWGGRSAVVALTGPVPAGLPGDLFRRSLAALKKCGAKTVVSATGKPLREALRQKPYLVKLDRQELEAMHRARLGDMAEVAAACRDTILKRGVAVACVTMQDRVLLVDRGGAASAPVQNHGNTRYYMEDCLLAGLCKGIREQGGLEVMLRYGVAAAAASAEGGSPLFRWNAFVRQLGLVEAGALPLPPAEPDKEDEIVTRGEHRAKIRSERTRKKR